jgi:hypothetical protein
MNGLNWIDAFNFESCWFVDRTMKIKEIIVRLAFHFVLIELSLLMFVQIEINSKFDELLFFTTLFLFQFLIKKIF